MSRTRRAALITLAALAVLALALVLWPRHSALTQDRGAILAGPTLGHIAGTDDLGRDRAVRIAAALLIGLAGAATAAAVSTAIAAAFGLLAAFAPGWSASLLLLVSDLFLSLPWLFLLMIVRAGLPLHASAASSAVMTFALLAALGWPACARAVFQGGQRLRTADWMTYARAAGLRPAAMARVHVLPHLRSLLAPQFLVSVPVFVVAEANLGALGLGVPEPLPSWGGMLAELSNSALLARSAWVYLPLGLLVLVLLSLETLSEESQ